ncbi:flagellar hook-length control protein [Mycolicibacterium hippocampi]|uniref:Flagellar hook-length control protein n=1 Tax=Mycolicibacterium hippocampi TaxID=659824 RepID=A0A850PUF4_9MYCO|nr:flagellar hook-length control protein [Mycolicibacterium hippocampi]NVN51690.1 hypothetical protein [Mycolicibacterium hippocampi]
MTTTEDVIKSAAAVARDAAEGRLSPAELDQAVADECKNLFGTVVGDGDPLWDLHRDITRQSIALGALSADELGEWQAVIRRREQQNGAVGAVEPSEAASGPDGPTDASSSASGPHSPSSGYSDAELTAD